MRKFLTILFICLKMGLLCSPSVFADSANDDSYDELQEQSEEMVDAVKDLQQKYSNKDVKLDPKQMEQTFNLIHEQFKDKSVKDIENDILSQAEGSYLHKFLQKFPKMLTYVATLMKDKEALPKASKIIEDHEKLKTAGLWMLGTFALSFILSKLLIHAGQGIFKRLWMYFLKSSILWGVRIGILVHFYGEYLNPMYKIFKKVFFV